jgi:hypothetical protein
MCYVFLECDAYKYGHGCAERCGHCFNGTCDKVTGVCTDNKCIAGYQGDKCKQGFGFAMLLLISMNLIIIQTTKI